MNTTEQIAEMSRQAAELAGKLDKTIEGYSLGVIAVALGVMLEDKIDDAVTLTRFLNDVNDTVMGTRIDALRNDKLQQTIRTMADQLEKEEAERAAPAAGNDNEAAAEGEGDKDTEELKKYFSDMLGIPADRIIFMN